MNRADLIEALAVERHTPSPRPPRFGHCDPPAPITDEQAARNRQILAEALGDDAVVIAFNERRSA